MLKSLKSQFAPVLDPPDSVTWWSKNRPLTRDRTPSDPSIPDEYVCSVQSNIDLSSVLREQRYRNNNTSTYKFIRSDEIIWESGSMAANRFNPICKECQQHAYWFEYEGSYHIHHHREWPIVRLIKHQSGSRTHKDPEYYLRGALSNSGVEWWVSEDPYD